ncbi:MAG: hypothetical protein KDA62_21485, partial [Planctomycetales bacterium]|nr:hypothetical protein [Planctomycetales bacterium]
TPYNELRKANRAFPERVELLVWDESGRLLLAMTGRSKFSDDIFEGRDELSDQTTEVCTYNKKEIPGPGGENWITSRGLSLTGEVAGSEFFLSGPVQTVFTDDGRYEVNWPAGHIGYYCDRSGDEYGSRGHYYTARYLVREIVLVDE